MNRKSMKLLVVGLTALCGCAGMNRQARQVSLERLDERSVNAPALEIDASHAPRFAHGSEPTFEF